MAEFAPLFRSIATDFPSVYRRDAESWQQLQDYLRILDEVCRQHINELLELPVWMSPAAVGAVPPGLDRSAPEREIHARQNELLDELASWFSFEFPRDSDWEFDAAADSETRSVILERKQLFLRKVGRLWRRRGTPVGFIQWFCACFALDARDKTECPVLIEHFAYRPPEVETLDSAAEDDPYALRATLFVPRLPKFSTLDGQERVRTWIESSAPVHIIVEHCMVPTSFWSTLLDDVLPHATSLEAIMKVVAEHVAEADAIHLANGETGLSQLGIGRLRGVTGPDRPSRHRAAGRQVSRSNGCDSHE